MTKGAREQPSGILDGPMDHKVLLTAYGEHLAAKRERWCSLLKRAGFAGPSGDIMKTDISSGFRSRMKFKVFRRGGLRAVGTDPLRGECPAVECLWALPRWSREQTTSILGSLLRREADFPVDGVEVQLAHGREEMHAVLSVSRGREESYREYAAALVNESPLLIGAAVPSQDISVGQPDLTHRILEFDLKAHFSAFFQSNLQLTPKIVSFVRSRCLEMEAERLLDLYCGVGLYSIIACRDCDSVWGVEANPSAVGNARVNARSMGLKKFRFYQTAVEPFVRRYRTRPSDCVILNPPRSGIGEDVIKRVSSGKPGRIISVSCNPDTQIRDLHTFQACGYHILETAAFDMFPFSPYLETAIILENI
jgi:tRNA/tmRNA/rRNA uracil-C5-methylase (TrmA/RlmC/RlmD family)